MKREIPENIAADNKNIRSYMTDMLIMLSAMAVVGVYTYGIRAALITLFTAAAAVLTEAAAYFLIMRKRPERLSDLSSLVTGIAVALSVPSSSPLWMAPVGAVFAVAVAKLPFGNAKTTPFVPAAAGIAFLSVSYPSYMFTYPSLNIGSLDACVNDPNFVLGESLASMLRQSKSVGMTVLNVIDVFVGRAPGPIGASCFIICLGALVYMAIRRHPGFITAISFLAACSLMAVLFPRVLTGRSYSLLMELSAGLLFFSAIFFVSDPAASPKNQTGKVLYGLSGGTAAMLLRYFGMLEASEVFAILILNAFSPLFEVWGQKLDERFFSVKAKASEPEKRRTLSRLSGKRKNFKAAHKEAVSEGPEVAAGGLGFDIREIALGADLSDATENEAGNALPGMSEIVPEADASEATENAGEAAGPEIPANEAGAALSDKIEIVPEAEAEVPKGGASDA